MGSWRTGVGMNYGVAGRRMSEFQGMDDSLDAGVKA